MIELTLKKDSDIDAFHNFVETMKEIEHCYWNVGNQSFILFAKSGSVTHIAKVIHNAVGVETLDIHTVYVVK